MKVLKAAVIGCGRIAHGFDSDPKRKEISTHIGAYKNVRGIEIAAVCDVDGKKAREVADIRGIKNSYDDYIEMLTREKVDIVSVCTPPSTHAAIVKDIARRGLARAIFCEKPMADSILQARSMIDACKKAGIILQIDHQRRFDQMHQAIRQKIHGGAWGKIQRANFYYSAGVSNTGSHMFDLMRFFFGSADWVQAYESANPSHRPQDLNLDGFVHFKNGLLASFQALDHAKFMVFELDCFFEKGRLTLTHSGMDADFWRVGDSRFFSGYRELIPSKPPFNTKYLRSEMVGAVQELASCLHTGRKSISSGIDGLGAMALIEASLKSARHQGKKISITQA